MKKELFLRGCFLGLGVVLTGSGTASPFLVSDLYPLQECPVPTSCSQQPPRLSSTPTCIPAKTWVTKINTLQPTEFSVKIDEATPVISAGKRISTGQVQLYHDLKSLMGLEESYTIEVIARYKTGTTVVVSCPTNINIDTHRPSILKGFSIIK